MSDSQMVIMKKLPDSVKKYQKTPQFSQESMPKGLLNAHKTKQGTWGKIIILKGMLRYRILEPRVEEIDLSPGEYGVVEPGILHEVEPLSEVVFYVEFYR
ncbi:DUF1971 domain-containing protein [Microbulbifer spongiae]|uniref:DUF1971 domain-containing protein n=1 Tax=Microbulbifer spongiae TaxID=2944933 RepID=A0ABY9E9D9_9GAMM|nr:DUF1971 domain-containing protein [Microbulbifer sp. MI-G]WKD48947.1 DUF1971 domain-containing protein [Microbulbifer sp. MI-G]